MYSNDDVTLFPDHGSKGTTKVTASVPENYSNDKTKKYEIQVISNGSVIKYLLINQERAPLLTIDREDIEVEQSASSFSVSIISNFQISVTIPEDCNNWLSYDLKPSDSNPWEYDLVFNSTLNESVNNRTCKVGISNQGISKTINITQKGGIILTTDIKDEATGEAVSSFSPQGGDYVMNISSNANWTYSLDPKSSNRISLTEILFDGKTGQFNISTNRIESDGQYRELILNIKFENGKEEIISIKQNNWDLTVRAINGEWLSSAISKLQDKINDGYQIKYLYIDGAILNCKAPETVTTVRIENVDNIPESFCSGCINLKSISLSNVKQIGARAFAGHKCNYLTIPATVTYIGDRAFLKSESWYPNVTCYNPTPPTLGESVFHSGAGDGWLKIPMGSKPKYKGNTKWSKQFNVFEEF